MVKGKKGFQPVAVPKRKNYNNREKRKSNKSFQLDVSPRCQAYLESLSNHIDRTGKNSMSRFINQGIEINFLMKSNYHRFIREMIRGNFREWKKMLRIIWREWELVMKIEKDSPLH